LWKTFVRNDKHKKNACFFRFLGDFDFDLSLKLTNTYHFFTQCWFLVKNAKKHATFRNRNRLEK